MITLLTNMVLHDLGKESNTLLKQVTGNLLSRSSLPAVFLGKGVLKIYSKFTGEYPFEVRFQ